MSIKQQTPQLRFTGFSEDWETDVFENIFYYERPDKYIVRSKEYSPTKPTPVLTANKSFILGYTDESSTYNKPSIIFDDFTLENRYIDFPYMVKSSALKILTTKYNYNLRFAHELLKSTKFEVIGHARHYISIVQPKEVFVPIEQEQAAIGNLFQNIDQTIALQRRKHEQTQTLKKSLLSKMFPKKGQKQPEIRLAGFGGDWVESNLSDMVKLITKGTSPIERDTNGDINFIKIENIDKVFGHFSVMSKISTEEHNGYLNRSKLLANDILFSIAGSLGRVAIVKNEILPANTNQALAIIRLNENVDKSFIYYSLRNDIIQAHIKKIPTVGAQPNLSLSQVNNFPIKSPRKIEEQTAIGQFFKQLDDTISLQAKQLKTLENLKKALLAKMFV